MTQGLLAILAVLVIIVIVIIQSGIYNTPSWKRTDGQVIDHLGEIYLGASISILDNLGYPTKREIVSGHVNYDQIIKNKYRREITEILPGNDAESYHTASLFDSVRVFHVPSFEIIKDLYVTNMILKFYNDSLYDVTCDANYQLAQALQSKYGPSRDKSERRHGAYHTEYKWPSGSGSILCEITEFTSQYATAKTFRLVNLEINAFVIRAEIIIHQERKKKKHEKL
ncbi:hypothetical protein [uncultured Alistipes sp.]|jgi:hypothetical protein|uniref:hypothetical protein n=1 Tax=uncultured Alistipes sp. TaxID=538949 RepID=UPI0025CBC9AF|nr:hypothetical protein [uncultured Alistipes sp.]